MPEQDNEWFNSRRSSLEAIYERRKRGGGNEEGSFEKVCTMYNFQPTGSSCQLSWVPLRIILPRIRKREQGGGGGGFRHITTPVLTKELSLS